MTRIAPASTFATLCFGALCIGLAACGSHDAQGGAAPGSKPGGSPSPTGRRTAAFPVEVALVASHPVESVVRAVGSVEAFEVVQVTARVPGAVDRISFREGDRAREGDLLVAIEPERYRLAVEEAQAALEKAKASLAEAQTGLARREGANQKNAGLIPGEELDAWRTRVLTAQAEQVAREAALQLAQRNAGDATARAPFAGTIQSRDVQTGQYVQPGTLLATLVRRDPLLLRFQSPDGDAARLNPGMKARFRVRNIESEFLARIVHVAERADPGSRMVAVTAEIEADDERLRPGAFAEVTVPVDAPRDAAVIPQTAVRPSERGFLAFVVQGGAARERVLDLGLRTPEGLVEVVSGLAVGDSLVVRGAEALRDGASVKVVPSGAAAPAAAPSAGEGPS